MKGYNENYCLKFLKMLTEENKEERISYACMFTIGVKPRKMFNCLKKFKLIEFDKVSRDYDDKGNWSSEWKDYKLTNYAKKRLDFVKLPKNKNYDSDDLTVGMFKIINAPDSYSSETSSPRSANAEDFNKDLEVSASPTPKESQKAIPSLNPDIIRNFSLGLKGK